MTLGITGHLWKVVSVVMPGSPGMAVGQELWVVKEGAVYKIKFPAGKIKPGTHPDWTTLSFSEGKGGTLQCTTIVDNLTVVWTIGLKGEDQIQAQSATMIGEAAGEWTASDSGPPPRR